MKKNIISFFATIIALFFVTCANNKAKLVFDNEKSISCTDVQNSLFLGLPINLIYFDNQLFISDFFSDTLITVFDLHEKKVAYKLITKGIGPNEMLPPVTISIKQDTLLTFNKNKFKLSYYHLKDKYPKENYYLFNVPTQVANLAYIHDESYIASGYFEQKRYAILNAKGEIEKEFGEFPHFLAGEKDRPISARAMFHQVKFEINRNIKKMACLSNHVLDIIDFSDHISVSHTILLDPYDYKFSTGDVLYAEKTDDTSKGAIDITSTDKYIYVLFNGSKNKSDELSNEIWVFDWDGSPIKKIKPDKNVCLLTAVNDDFLYALVLINENYEIVELNTGFCVNEEKRIIIGVGATGDQPVVEWSMK